MKIVMAVLMGLVSGFLIYMMIAMVTTDLAQGGPPTALIMTTFIGGWIASTYLLLRQAKTTAKVISRGFLLGAAEWLMMIIAGFIFSGKAVTATTHGSDAAAAGAAIGGGITAFITGGVSIFMAFVCMLGFAVTYFMSREMKPEHAGPTRKCPECAELIQTEARRCKHCGVSLA